MKTKSKTITFGGFTLFLLLMFFISQTPVNAWFWDSKDSKKSGSEVSDNVIGVKKTSDGAVTVDLTPIDYSDGKLFVRIGVDTHSVDDLDTYDLKRITTLDAGSFQIKPVSAPRLGGHHGGGKIVFELEKLPAAFKISIKDLDNNPNREFIWP
jgi:hypothetical protein